MCVGTIQMRDELKLLVSVPRNFCIRIVKFTTSKSKLENYIEKLAVQIFAF